MRDNQKKAWRVVSVELLCFKTKESLQGKNRVMFRGDRTIHREDEDRTNSTRSYHLSYETTGTETSQEKVPDPLSQWEFLHASLSN